MESKYIISIAIFILVLSVDLATDYTLWKKNKPVNHNFGLAIRIAGLVPVFILLDIKSVVMVGAVYFLLFDGIFNIARGFNWWFTGSDDKDDAATDNFLQKIPLWAHITLKIVLIIIGVVIFIKL